MSTSVHQMSYDLLCQVLRAVLLDVVESGSHAVRRIEVVEVKACAALYGILLGHPIDRQGRCRSCRRPGAVFGWRRRRCWVRVEASFWLHQPNHTFLLSRLADELRSPPPGGGSPQVGWSDRDHSGPGEYPDRPPHRRISCEDPPAEPLGQPGADRAQDHREARLLPDSRLVARRRRWLTGTELLDWIALRRVCQGGVAMLGSHYLDHGQRVPCFLPEAFRRLADAKLTGLLNPDHPGGLRRVVITLTGRARYQELSAARGPSLYGSVAG